MVTSETLHDRRTREHRAVQRGPGDASPPDNDDCPECGGEGCDECRAYWESDPRGVP